MADQLLGRFLSVFHLAALALGRVSLSICSDRYGFWRHSGLSRLRDDPLGKPGGGLFYTPNRWLAVVVTLVIAARFVYGWWRATHPGSRAPGEQHWLITASGTQLSLAVAAGLIGYYLVYSIGVRLRMELWDQRHRR